MNSTKKKSFFVAVICLVLCVALLVGTTFAWFSDSVSNTGNKIQAGTLDVELWQTASSLNAAQKSDTSIKDTSDTAYKNISASETEVYGYDKWEPGYSTPAGFKVYNAGNLVLKYELTFKLTSSKTGLENTDSAAYDFEHLTKCNANSYLENVLEVYKATSKAECTQANYLGKLSEFFDQTVSYSGYVLPGQTSDAIDLVVLMPESAGNEYENALINFDIDLKAMQYTYEEDGFGSNQYDALADGKPDHTDWNVDVKTTQQTKTVQEGEPTVFTLGNTVADQAGLQTTVSIPTGTAGFETDSSSTITVETTPIISANNTFTVSSEGAVGAIDLSVKVDGTEVTEFKDAGGNPVPVKVTTYVAKNMTNVTLSYNDTETWTLVENEADVDAVGEMWYDKVSGKLVYMTSHFSTFVLGADEVAYDAGNNSAYLKLSDAIGNAADNNDTITLLKDCTSTGTIRTVKNFTLDLNRQTLTLGSSGVLNYGYDSSNKKYPVVEIIKNGTIDAGNSGSNYIRFEDGSGCTFTDVNFRHTGASSSCKILQTYATNTTQATGKNTYSFTNCIFDNSFVSFEGSSSSFNEYDVKFNKCAFENVKLGNGGSCVSFSSYNYGNAEFKEVSFDFTANGNAVSAVNGQAYNGYLGENKMNITLTDSLSNSHYLSGNGYRTIRKNDDSTVFTLNNVICTYEGTTVVPADGDVCKYKYASYASTWTKTTGLKVANNNCSSGGQIVLTWDNDGLGYSESFELKKGVTFDTGGLNYTGTVTAPAGCIVVKEGNIYKAVVAENNGIKYGTINDAINAASAGNDKVVKLLCDNVADTASLKPGVSLDTNGYAYTKTVSASDANHAVSYDETTGIYTVVDAVAKYANKGYASLAAAANAVTSSNWEITLLQDSSEDVVLPAERCLKVYLNTNGKNYTGSVSAPSGYEVVQVGNVYGIAAVSLQIGSGDVVKYLATKVTGTSTSGTAANAAANATDDCEMVFLQNCTDNPWLSGPQGEHTLTVKTNGKTVTLYAMSDSIKTDLGNGIYTFVRK